MAVLVATASVRDAGELADDHALLHTGALVGQAASLDTLSSFSARGARMRVMASDPQALVAALAREPEVEAVARRDGVVVARGRDARLLARAVGRAVLASGVEVVEMRLEPPSLDDARQAVAGVAQATYEAARARTWPRALRPDASAGSDVVIAALARVPVARLRARRARGCP